MHNAFGSYLPDSLPPAPLGVPNTFPFQLHVVSFLSSFADVGGGPRIKNNKCYEVIRGMLQSCMFVGKK